MLNVDAALKTLDDIRRQEALSCLDTLEIVFDEEAIFNIVKTQIPLVEVTSGSNIQFLEDRRIRNAKFIAKAICAQAGKILRITKETK